jgi:hypothetical protein
LQVRGPLHPPNDRTHLLEHQLTTIPLGENNLSFIETSALDASNVELAFQNILTGAYSRTPDAALS